jgi:integrase
MQPHHITGFLTDSINDIVRCLKSMLCHLRVLFRYLYLNGHNEKDLSLFLPRSNVLLRRQHIPTTWTREDVDRILSCVDVANPVGKRDYAMILLVARLGIRVSDIIHLKFDNIKWDKNCISISQHKTNEPLVLPLFEDVGNAIIDYVKNGRPPTDLDRVFITHRPPFQNFSDNNHLHGMFNHYLRKSGIIVTSDKNHGMHSLRHTLANELLRKEIPLPVISEILGHRSLESTMQYLRADTEQLRYCTLTEGDNYAT